MNKNENSLNLSSIFQLINRFNFVYVASHSEIKNDVEECKMLISDNEILQLQNNLDYETIVIKNINESTDQKILHKILSRRKNAKRKTLLIGQRPYFFTEEINSLFTEEDSLILLLTERSDGEIYV